MDGGRFEGAFAHVAFGILDRTKNKAVRGAFEQEFTAAALR